VAQEHRVLHYFVDLISKGWLSKIWEEFKHPELTNFDLDYNPRTNSQVALLEEDGQLVEFIVSFDEHLKRLLEPEFDRAVTRFQEDYMSHPETAPKVYLSEIDQLKNALSGYGMDEGREVVRGYLDRLQKKIEHLLSTDIEEDIEEGS